MKEIIAFIIVNYKKYYEVIRLIIELENLESKYKIFTIVIDSGSGDKEVELLRNGLSKFKNYEMLFLKENIGYSKGNNIGLRRAKELKIKYAIISNPDISISKDSNIDELIDVMVERKDCSVAYPQVYNPYEKRFEKVYYNPDNLFWLLIYPNLFFLFYPLTKIQKYLRIYSKNTKNIHKVYSAIGCFLAVNIIEFEKLGYYDEDFFLYAEEQVIGEKMRRAKKKSYLIFSSKVLHEHKLEKTERERPLDSYILFLMKYKRYNRAVAELIAKTKNKYSLKKLLFK